MISEYHWKNIQRYIYQIPNNPFVRELKDDLWKDLQEQQRKWVYAQLCKLGLSLEMKDWVDKLSLVSLEWLVDTVNTNEDMTMIYNKSVEMKTQNPERSYDEIIDTLDDLTDLSTSDNNENESDFDDIKSTTSVVSTLSITSRNGLYPRLLENEFRPTELKMVTSTAVCSLLKEDGSSFEVDFKQFYNDYDAPPLNYYNMITKEYHCDWIGRVVGCKTGSFEPKGRYHPHNVAQFFNSVTLIVSIDKKKEVNVKLFKNGKLQLTGIPSMDAGSQAVNIVMRYIENTYHMKLRINKYMDVYDIRTVMLNTCYEIGFPIHREVLYNILTTTYRLVAMYDTEGYPGVRIHYYYNKETIDTEKEGQCCCPSVCKGNGDGEKIGECKRISIAVFQSGKIIIAGGCHTMEPIECAYEFMNRILKESHANIRKLISNERATKRKRNSAKQSHDMVSKMLEQNIKNAKGDTGETTKIKWIKIDKAKVANVEQYKTLVVYCTQQINKLAKKSNL